MTTNVLARLPGQGEPDLLLLLFHGVGANAEHMAVLATRLAQEYPQAAVLCIDAPDEFDAAPGRGGRQWFSIQGIDEQNRPARVAAVDARVRNISCRVNGTGTLTAEARDGAGNVLVRKLSQLDDAEKSLVIWAGVAGAALVFRFSWGHAAERLGSALDSLVQSRRKKSEIAEDLAVGKRAAREREEVVHEERIEIREFAGADK